MMVHPHAAEAILYLPLDVPTEDLLVSGGDSRIQRNRKGINKYGCGPFVQNEVLAFGACTASSPSRAAMSAARLLHAKLREHPSEAYGDHIANSHRQQLGQLLDLPEDADVVFAPSGTDAELLALVLMLERSAKPVLNIVVGPSEVGSGSPIAAAGCYHNRQAPDGSEVEPGKPLDARFAERVSCQHVEVRTGSGDARNAADVDAEVTERIAEATASGSDVLLHLVLHSKTGISAPSLECVTRVLRHMQDDVVVVVDAAQGRVRNDTLRWLLSSGCMVIWTASKFFGGPPFAGVLLTPGHLRPSPSVTFPAELSRYFCLQDLPTNWRAAARQFTPWRNAGSLVRWSAGLREIERYFSVPIQVRDQIMASFEAFTSRRLHDVPSIDLVGVPINGMMEDSSRLGIESRTTVFTFGIHGPELEYFDKCALQSAHQTLLNDGNGNGERFHLGQPVKLCHGKWALRLALGAPMVSDLATDVSFGKTLKDRLDWLDERIQQLCRRIDNLASLVATDDQPIA